MNRSTGLLKPSLLRNMYCWSGLLAAVILVAGWYFVVAFTNYGENVERRALLATTSAAAAAFDIAEVAGLKGNADDLTTRQFAQVRVSLKRIRASVEDSRFAYLMALRNDEVVFLADAEEPASPDYSPPGQIYTEATPLLRGIFVNGKAATEGPMSDRWGRWVSGLTPLLDPHTGGVVAILGVDISAEDWETGVARFHWLGVAISGSLATVIALFSYFIFRERRLGERLATASRIVENSTTILYRLAGEPSLPLRFISSNVARLGYDPHELLASPGLYRSLFHPDDQASVKQWQRQMFDADVVPEPIHFRIRAKDGTYSWVEDRVTPIRDKSGRLLVAEGMLVDIDYRKQMDEKLQLANILLTTQMETSPDGILVVDTAATIISFNHRFAAMWKIPLDAFRSGQDAPILAAVSQAMKDPAAFAARVQHLYAHPEELGHEELETTDGRFIERHTAALRTSTSVHLGRVWFFRDITDRKQAEAEIRHTARHDALTGLANRRMFMEMVRRAMEREGQRSFAVLYLDLDHFKDINDTLGHPVGDELLCLVAERLRSNVRGSDSVARFGGDEFAIIMSAVGEPVVVAGLAEKLVAAIGSPYSVQGNIIVTSVSIGVAVCGPDDTDAEVLLSHADVALYRAKSEGRGAYRFFTEAMDRDVRARVSAASELREALRVGQLFLLYQPQIEIITGRIIGLEALVRWHHPERGVVGPDEFIGVAEKTGLIVALGRWVLGEACRQGKEWLDAGAAPISIAVNVSAWQFKMAPALEHDIASSLATSGFPPRSLELELTESGLMEASLEHRDALVRLRKTGIRFAIDDFGTGYSSLEYLRRYPADRVKIAQEFVRLIVSDPESAAIVKAIIGLSQDLGMVVIAEGVETSEQLELLKAWGCREVQGYYFARPLAAEDVWPLLQQGNIREPEPVVAGTAPEPFAHRVPSPWVTVEEGASINDTEAPTTRTEPLSALR
jgi:diguanylate cyclase (GGDEF)-like protein/PAS domain S-box-containing protein